MSKVNEERIKDGQPVVKPCELFDLIGGTSTGGYAFVHIVGNNLTLLELSP